MAKYVEHSTYKLAVVGSIHEHAKLTITYCFLDETLNRGPRVTVLYTEHVKEQGGTPSSFILYPCTIPRDN